MAVKLQIRRGTSTEWGSSTEILSAGELVWASDTKQFKVGDGTKTWAQLEYVAGPTGLTGPGVPSGGIDGQILKKVGTGTGTDYSTSWTSSYVTSVNGASGAITGLATSASPTFTGTVTLPSNVSLASLGSGTPYRYLAVTAAGALILGSSPSATATASTLALRDGTGNLFATAFSGSSFVLSGSLYTQTILPSSITVTGGNHSFYLPQLSTAPYSATLISNADSKTVTTAMLADTSVTLAKLADNSVTSDKIVNGSIVNEDISATAGIATSKLQSSSVTINTKTVSLGGAVVITAMPDAHASSHGVSGADPITVAQSQVTGLSSAITTLTDGVTAATTLANTKVASVAAGDGTITVGGTSTAPTVKLANSSITINGTPFALGESKSIQAVPTDSSVTDAKITTTLSPSKITGTAATLSSANLFVAPSNLTPITIKGYGATITPANLQEWWNSAPSASAAAWVSANGTLVSKVGINAGLVPTTGTLGILTVQPDGETSGKGLVIRRSGTGNVFEVQEANTGSALFTMDYQGLIKAPSSSQSALKIADSGASGISVTINSGSYDSATQTLTLGCLSSTGLSNGAKVTFSSFIGDLAFLNAGTYTMIYNSITGGTAFTIKYATDISPTDFPTSGAYAYGNLPGQSVDIQKWQVVGDANVSGVDSSGYLYSTKFYTRYVPNLSPSTGYNGYAGSTADLISKSLGVYDTTGKNQIFGNTTIGYAISSSNANPIGTQYGVLQVFKQSAGTGTSSVLAVRATSGTGWLQTWMAGTTSKANMDMTGSLTLSGSVIAPGGISLVSGGTPVANTLTGTGATFTYSFTVGNSSTFAVTAAPSSADYLGTTAIKGKVNVTGGVVTSTNINVDSINSILLPSFSSLSGSGLDYNLATATSFTLSSASNQLLLPPDGSKVRIYTANSSTGAIYSVDDWAEGTVSTTSGGASCSVTVGLRGPKAGANYVSSTPGPMTYVKIVPISIYTDSEIRTTESIFVGAEGTKLKRSVTGSGTINFSSGAGAITHGAPFTPSTIVVTQIDPGSNQQAVGNVAHSTITSTTATIKGWNLSTNSVLSGTFNVYWMAVE